MKFRKKKDWATTSYVGKTSFQFQMIKFYTAGLCKFFVLV